MKTAVVVGANGVIGGNLVEHLQRTGDWNIIGLSRSGGIDSERVQHIAVDLLDGDETRRRLSHLTDVTHIFYAAYQERPTWAELVPPNLAMLVNVVTVIEDSSPNLEHVSLMQGYKVYGAHLGPFKTPARETDPPHMPPEFNIDQQQFLESRQVGKRWSWSAIRPSVVCGVALGNPMNLATVIAVYATMCKKLGVPMRFPGKPGAFGSLLEMTDASLLAEATVWAATTPACANQAFNITNGDLFRWNDMWPRIADIFGLDTATPLPMSLADVMADKESLWNSIVAEHELKPTPYRDVSSWAFGDFVFSWDYDVISDGSKARRMGFHRFVDTEAMFAGIVTDLRQQRIIP
ncbi:NAD-dependent dehydratase [Rhodococcus sp. 05-2256-B2]|uniref:SDR family oxidoreductase n=1 Tax=unclassified Rhodococcus (in: high G+C Gram-positive bacteria) TaxID=192944 RepID=UPI000B9C4DC5|nr:MULTISPECIES: SDR family oxidoreductase [unclassified Rhodococcus (in: high G+C Gram-positive bacteria)]OZD87584.1 NAD-dependent dehydratase [Rhodococcus sp. 05-2256-B4]OZD89849.1 NAD-dependent dehydratase [Rhodococcus sp. 05-2256-B2]OZD92167.1 NAD-dependent dehydratase [Rhodococcus sp. 05-2256-B3]OZD98872.1 NAD-dependent dehydratase [Rhodococcus sp. 05-2256-B1]